MSIKTTNVACGSDIDAREAFAGIVLPPNDHFGADDFLRGISDPTEWGEIAHLAMCTRRGSAQSLSVSGRRGATLEADGTILLNGQGTYDGDSLNLAARFSVSTAGRYSAAVRLKRKDPTWTGACAFGINGIDLGTVMISPEPKVYTFVFKLAAGDHGFLIGERGINVYFFGLTIFTTPILSP